MMQNRIADYLPRAWQPKHGKPGATLQVSEVNSLVKPANEFIARHPGACLAAAFAVGVTLAWWIKRK